MTGAVPLRHAGSDAELAVAAADGDRQALGAIYDRYSDRLYDFCAGMVGDRDAAADCVQDVFCVAATNLSALRDPDKLRPWLYSVARNQAMRRLRDRYREQVSDDLPDAASPEAGPETIAGRSELANLVAAAAGGLSDRDRTLLELTYRHGFDGPDVADALGVTLTNANTMVFRLRKTVERSLGALLLARSVRSNRHACPGLAAALQGWDGDFTVLTRKRVARHVESCPTCAREQRRRVSPVALLGGAPLFIPAPGWLRDQTFRRVQLTCASARLDNTEARPLPHDGRHMLPRVAMIIGIPLSCLGLTMAWLRPVDTAVTMPAADATRLEPARQMPNVVTTAHTPTAITTQLPPVVDTSTSPRRVPTTPVTTPLPSPTRPSTTSPTTAAMTTTPSTTPLTTNTWTTTPWTTTPWTTTPQTTTPWTTTPWTTPVTTTTPYPTSAAEPVPAQIPTPTTTSEMPNVPDVH